MAKTDTRKQAIKRGFAYGIARIARLEVWTQNVAASWKSSWTAGGNSMTFDLDALHKSLSLDITESCLEPRGSHRRVMVTLDEPAVRALYAILHETFGEESRPCASCVVEALTAIPEAR